MSSISSTPSSLNLNGFVAKTGVSNTGTFLGYSEKSPVQQMLDAQKAKKAKLSASFEDNPTFMAMKAQQLKALMVVYQNMGQTDAYNSTYNEAVQLVQRYEAMQKKQAADAVKAAGGTSDLQSAVNNAIKSGQIDTSA